MVKDKHLGLRIDSDTHRKLKLLSEYEGRSINGQILYLIRQSILEHEKKHGKLNNMLSVHNLPTALFSDKSAVASDSKPVPGALFALLTNPNPSLLTKCTKNLFSSSLIHTIHTFSTNIIKKLFTSYLVHFKGKNSYAPSYPHYPHFFNVYHQLSTPVFPH